MKKIFLNIFLIFFLVSCSEQKKVEKAIENCADQSWHNDWSRGMYMYDKEIKDAFKDPKWIVANQKYLDFYNKKKSYKKEKLLFFRDYEKNSPKPNIFNSESIKKAKSQQEINKLMKDDTVALNKWYAKYNKEKRIYKNQLDELESKENFYFKTKIKIQSLYADKVFKKWNLKNKSMLSNYVDYFGKCEKKYNELPNKFLMQFSK